MSAPVPNEGALPTGADAHAAAPAATLPPSPGPRPGGAFTTGSMLRHILVMTATGAVGLMAVFVVDLLTLFYVSRLGDPSLTAAVGYASNVLFLAVSINIGLMIAAGALVARALGAGDRDRARELGGSVMLQVGVVSGLVGIVLLPVREPVLELLGASGEALEVASRFLAITLLSNVLMGLGMAYSGVLRAVGDARRAMWVTLSGGLATAVIDPVLIFGLGLGVDGAAVALVLSRLVFTLVGFHGAVRVHDLVARPDPRAALADAAPVFAIAGPAVLANVATPIANAIMTRVVAEFGDEAVAGNAVVARLVPVAFGVLFAASGAVGPVLGQNLGAGLLERVRSGFTSALVFCTGAVAVAWLALALGADLVVSAFGVTGEGEAIVRLFCLRLAGSWAFHGFLFVANAAFNNLGFPLLATALNWGKATLGTLPFAYLGARWGGAEGALAGQAVGAVLFGVAGVAFGYGAIGRLKLPGGAGSPSAAMPVAR